MEAHLRGVRAHSVDDSMSCIHSRLRDRKAPQPRTPDVAMPRRLTPVLLHHDAHGHCVVPRPQPLPRCGCPQRPEIGVQARKS